MVLLRSSKTCTRSCSSPLPKMILPMEKRVIMKRYGTVRGNTIQLDEALELPEGQPVEVELRPLVEDPVLGAAREIRSRLLQRWGRPLDLSLQFLREDREQ